MKQKFKFLLATIMMLVGVTATHAEDITSNITINVYDYCDEESGNVASYLNDEYTVKEGVVVTFRCNKFFDEPVKIYLNGTAVATWPGEDTDSKYVWTAKKDAKINWKGFGQYSANIYLTETATVDVTGITLAPATADMTVGGTQTLTANVLPDNATDKTVTWTTSNAAVATVANGVVTAVAAGTATITATATNGTADTSDDQTATCTVTVSNPTVTANEGATGEYWATYYNGTTSFTADENTTVFQAALSGSSLTLTEVPNREIPATKAVILKSSSATITLTPASTTETLEGNLLVGTATAITNPGNAYVLNKKSDVVGFYKLSSTGTIGANKAYLTYSGGAGAREFFLFDEATGIEMPTVEDNADADAVVYDLQGRRVAQPTKGLYIVNGKKVIIK
ncbi:MAG: Ig domain-containing protein [Prevotella sp.]|nr:Ig domain-containing protein [Prevotella sp.]